MPNEMQELIEAAKVISEYGSKCKSANCQVDRCHHWRALYAAIEAAELARASEGGWIEIKEGCVPAAGDQLLAIDPEGKVFDLQIVSSRMPSTWIWSDYIADWFTHFRPMDAPTPKRKCADNGDPDTIVPAPAPHKKHPGYAK